MRSFTDFNGWELQLDRSATEVFTAMLDGACDQILCAIDQPPLDYEATVQIRGGVHGQCVLQCSPETARLLAERLIFTPVEAGDPLALDALGELSNVIAGAWKNRIAQLAAQACTLSTPQVTASPDERSGARDGRRVEADGLVCRRCYTFADQPLEILLFADAAQQITA